MRIPLRPAALVTLATLLLAAPAAFPQNVEEREDGGIRQAVARLSWFEGDVSFNRGDDPDDWQTGAVNYPFTLGDRIWVGRRGRAELQLRGSSVFLAPGSDLGLLDLTRDVTVLSLTLGTATFRIRDLECGEVFEVATPNASVRFEWPGVYRVDVDEDGNSRVAVSQGRARADAERGQLLLETGERMHVSGLRRPEYGVVDIGRPDAWDRWVEDRAHRSCSVRSSSFVHPDVYGLEDLDSWGTWEETPEWGFVWYPRSAGPGWAPYRYGRWIWRDPWGWTWLSDEPWGWAPYHHGRWGLVRNRWAWIPVGPRGRAPTWFPAIVGFVGGGPGWSVSVSAGGFVGWFPLGPGEPFHPWWRGPWRHTDPPGHRYAYRDRGVVVPRDVFVRGHWGDRDIVRDDRVLREISGAPVLRGPIPVVPTRDAIRPPRGTSGERDAATPPRRTTQRPVATRREVPPPPPTFDRKVVLIRERGGEPIPVDEPRPAEASARPTRGPAATPTVPVPTRPARRTVEAPQPEPEPLTVRTPAPPRVDVPAPRPTRPAVPTPTSRPSFPTPTARPRYEAPPTPAPRATAVPTAASYGRPAPTRAPQVQPAPTRPAVQAVPAPATRSGTTAAPTAVPRSGPVPAPTKAKRAAPEETHEEVPAETPAGAPPRRVTPGPG